MTNRRQIADAIVGAETLASTRVNSISPSTRQAPARPPVGVSSYREGEKGGGLYTNNELARASASVLPGAKVPANIGGYAFFGDFVPLDTKELIDLRKRLLKGLASRTVSMYQVYNGPSTRAKTSALAKRAMQDMADMGLAKKLDGGRQWRIL